MGSATLKATKNDRGEIAPLNKTCLWNKSWEDFHGSHLFASARRRVAVGCCCRCGASRSETAGAGRRPVGGRQAWLLLRRRQVCRRARQGHHAGPSVRRGASAEKA